MARGAGGGWSLGHCSVVSRCRPLALARAGRYVSQEGLFWLLVTCMLCNALLAFWRIVVYVVSHEVYLLVYGVVTDWSDVAGCG